MFGRVPANTELWPTSRQQTDGIITKDIKTIGQISWLKRGWSRVNILTYPFNLFTEAKIWIFAKPCFFKCLLSPFNYFCTNSKCVTRNRWMETSTDFSLSHSGVGTSQRPRVQSEVGYICENTSHCQAAPWRSGMRGFLWAAGLHPAAHVLMKRFRHLNHCSLNQSHNLIVSRSPATTTTTTTTRRKRSGRREAARRTLGTMKQWKVISSTLKNNWAGWGKRLKCTCCINHDEHRQYEQSTKYVHNISKHIYQPRRPRDDRLSLPLVKILHWGVQTKQEVGLSWGL